MKFNYRTATQIANFFAIKEGGEIDKRKLMKLVWLADKYHLLRFGRPVVGDQYFAMKNGPVPSGVLNLVKHANDHVEADMAYVRDFISSSKYDVTSHKDFEPKWFSQSDLQAMEFVYSKFGEMDSDTIFNFSHNFPEWKKHEEYLKSVGETGRIEMSYDDFFNTCDIFGLSEDCAAASSEKYLEKKKIEAILG